MHFLLLLFYFLSLDEKAVMRMAYLVCLAAIPLLSYQQLYSYYTTGSMLTLTPYYRAQGMMSDPNEFAKNVVVVILVLFFIIFFENIATSLKLICFACIGIMLSLLVWSGSRGGFVMLALGIFLFWLLLFRHLERRLKNIYYISMVLALAVLAIFLSKYDYFSLRFSGLMGGDASRASMVSEGLQLLFRGKLFNFLFGYGAEAWPSHVFLSIFPHNFIIEYLFEFGYVLGLALLATLAAVLLFPLWQGRRIYCQNFIGLREYRLLKMLFIVAFCASIPSLFNHILPTNFTFIFFTGLYLSLYRFLRERGAAGQVKRGAMGCAEQQRPC
ncbi:MAG: O-antigen ligase family protein [Firmicutes bacterium]|nr:O-antigen ligase family protein [Bacillota bacterium]